MAPKRRKKRVAQGSLAPKKKTVPAWADAPLFEERRISWSFAAPDLGGSWSWSGLEDKRLPEILKTLGQIEKLNQQAIKNYRSIVPVSKLEKSARGRLSEIGRDDLERLVGFHISGRERLWCAPYDGVMFVLWWDPEHTVYIVNKKHT